MSVPNDSPTLLDITRRIDPNGAISVVGEILTETNEMLMDIPFLEGNLPTGHRSTIRTGLPAPTWREFYGRVQPTKSRTAQVTDTTAMLEDYAEVDAKLADLNGNAMAFRATEDYAHIEGMSQAAQQAFIYGNANTNPNQFNGLAPRFSSVSLATAETAENVIDAGGTGSDNASIWLVCWGPGKVWGITPKGMPSGLKVEDKGRVTSEGGIGTDGEQKGLMEVYRTHYSWDLGLVVQDWRYIVRIANIDRSDLSPTGATGANLASLMFDAIELLPNLSGRMAFYMDRRVRSILRKQIASGVSNATLTMENVGGVRIVEFDGIPLRKVDKLAVNEARVV